MLANEALNTELILFINLSSQTLASIEEFENLIGENE